MSRRESSRTLINYLDPQAKIFLDIVAQGMAAAATPDGRPDIVMSRSSALMQGSLYDALARPVARVTDVSVPGPSGMIECRV